MLSIKRFGQKIGIQFEKDLFVVKQKKYATKIVTAYVVYDLDTWPKIPLKNFTWKNCLFCTTNILKNGDKEK